MNDSNYRHLLEQSWRRRLTEAEQAELNAWLAANPKKQADWDLDQGLSTALERLPDTPVASNFTARVLQAVEQDAANQWRPQHFGFPWPWRLRWLPKAAFATLVLGVGLFSYYQVMAAKRAAEMARSLTTFSGVTSLPSPEILKDFDVIQALDPSPPADEELLMLLRSMSNPTKPATSSADKK